MILPWRVPPSRSDVRAVYDDLNHRIVLFGGIQDNNFLGDTWVFDGEAWFQIHLPINPSASIWSRDVL